MNRRKRKYGLQTRLTHGTQETNETTAVSPPIFQTSTFILRTPEEGAELATQIEPTVYYTRYGSPNTKQVEEMLTSLEESEAALAVGSGMAALTTALLANLQTGDHVVAQHTHYTATLSLLAHTLPRYGIEVTYVGPTKSAEQQEYPLVSSSSRSVSRTCKTSLKTWIKRYVRHFHLRSFPSRSFTCRSILSLLQKAKRT